MFEPPTDPLARWSPPASAKPNSAPHANVVAPHTTTVTFNVLSLTSVRSGKILALADVEIVIDGVALLVSGLQMRASSHETRVDVPTHRMPNGEWKPSVSLPEELMTAIAEAVVTAGVNAGLLKRVMPLPKA
ncbi:conserved hypothetical protein [Candidatus Terasakiella magnetica]|nr:conserved hypothetical protein [Candidatus Terasakiella magnetica]